MVTWGRFSGFGLLGVVPDGGLLQIRVGDHPRSVFGGLFGREDFVSDHRPDDTKADAQQTGGFRHGLPCAGFGFREHGDAVLPPEVLDPGFVPAVPLPSQQAGPVEHAGDITVVPTLRQLPDQFDNIGVGSVAVFSGLVLADAQWGVHAASPVDLHFDVAAVMIDVHDDFVDHGPENTLLQVHGS